MLARREKSLSVSSLSYNKQKEKWFEHRQKILISSD